ncbi:MAG: LLM class flavin-dependent oxidoreductase, partial [Actinomycetota bacterium]
MGSQRDSLAGVRIGMVVLPTDPWPETLATVQRLDRLGYDHVWLYDHLTWRQYRDRAWHATYPLLAGLAVGTRRIRLGTMVANLNVRHPVTLAKDAMTIDHLSGGRMVLGVGAAGLGFDATVLGQAPLTPRQRVDRLEEALELLDRLLLDDAPDRQPVDHGGDWYTVEGARNLPGCVQRPRIPLAVAAGGHRSIDVAARMGDAWITYGDAIGTDGHQDTMRVVADEIDRL